MTKQIPVGWQCNPEHCEFLGTDTEGNEYWQIGGEVMRHQDGGTRWLCTAAAWPTYCRIVAITA